DEVVTRFERGDLTGAVGVAQDVVRQRPDMPLSLTHLAFLYNEAGDHQSAIAAITRALELNPAATDVAALMGAYLTEAGQARAAAAFSEALRIDPNTSRAHNGLAVIAAERGDLNEAIAHWQRALAVDPRDYQSLYNLGDLLVRVGRADEARPYWDRYLRDAPTNLEARDIARVRQWLRRHPPVDRH